MIQDISPRKFHIEYVSAQPSDGDFMLCFDREMRGIYIKKSADASDSITFPLVGEVKYSGEARYLFSIDDTRFFFAEDADCTVPDGFEAVGLRQLRHAQPGWLAFAGAVGFRLRTWYRDNRFCGRCGAKLRHSETERAMVCLFLRGDIEKLPEAANLVMSERARQAPDKAAVPVTARADFWLTPKKGKLMLEKGAFDDCRTGENPCGLKLKYNARNGTFSGSFTAYLGLGYDVSFVGGDRCTVKGVWVDGAGYGYAVSKVGNVYEVSVR